MMTTEQFSNKMITLKKLINKWLQPFGVQAITLLHGRMGELMVDNPNPTYPTGLEELQVVTGRLFRSFMLSSDETASEIDNNSYGLNIYFGSKVPYATIHEYGGLSEEGWRIPARHYFSKTIDRFSQKDLDNLKNEITLLLIKNVRKYLK